MKLSLQKLLFICFLFSSAKTFSASKAYIFGVSMNGTSFIGDIGSTAWLKTPHFLAPGFFYTYSATSRTNYRLSYNALSIQGKDSESDISSRKLRNSDFSNTIHEFMGSMEFSFNRFYNDEKTKQESDAYIQLGLAALLFEDSNKNYSATIGIPIGIGYRWILNNFVVNFELSPRYTLSDNLDHSEDNADSNNTNSKNNDWYISAGISIGYLVKHCDCTPYK